MVINSIFVEENCTGDFARFNEWFVDFVNSVENEVLVCNNVISNMVELLLLYRLMPEDGQKNIKNIISIILAKKCLPVSLDNTQSFNVFKMVISDYLKKNRILLRNIHLVNNMCIKDESCLVCRFCNVPRTLIFVDDFAGIFINIVFGTGNFNMIIVRKGLCHIFIKSSSRRQKFSHILCK